MCGSREEKQDMKVERGLLEEGERAAKYHQKVHYMCVKNVTVKPHYFAELRKGKDKSLGKDRYIPVAYSQSLSSLAYNSLPLPFGCRDPLDLLLTQDPLLFVSP